MQSPSCRSFPKTKNGARRGSTCSGVVQLRSHGGPVGSNLQATVKPGLRMSESGDVVVITGASGGIGAALAKRLGREGKRLVLAARRESELRSIAGDAEAA